MFFPFFSDFKPGTLAIRSVREIALTFRKHLEDLEKVKKEYDWMIAKDVFEHISEYELRKLFTGAKQSIKKIFAVIPLGIDDSSDKFIIPDYHNDITHITIKDIKWWIKLFTSCGWIAETVDKKFSGVKENWTNIWPEGNAFFVLSRE